MSMGFSDGREKEGSSKGRIRGEAVKNCIKGWFDLKVGLGKIFQGVICPGIHGWLIWTKKLKGKVSVSCYSNW